MNIEGFEQADNIGVLFKDCFDDRINAIGPGDNAAVGYAVAGRNAADIPC
ncbi:MAG: hypothetical protein Hyperionvirus2_200 [Hyperionvirus sp.]|uniref:Uncharacterized protein n=1 Tax=Hyperionvirus sp. TaxID=2487770 RepID=A0A3G5A721_9VIRU|nr:MAG: hypothetical protein Hyperionvirus2_200 [Hyperionvirus sp.]